MLLVDAAADRVQGLTSCTCDARLGGANSLSGEVYHQRGLENRECRCIVEQETAEWCMGARMQAWARKRTFPWKY